MQIAIWQVTQYFVVPMSISQKTEIKKNWLLCINSIGIIGKQSKEVDGILYQQLTRDEMIDILIQERFGYTDKGVA